jgi:hypothetical protein
MLILILQGLIKIMKFDHLVLILKFMPSLRILCVHKVRAQTMPQGSARIAPEGSARNVNSAKAGLVRH